MIYDVIINHRANSVFIVNLFNAIARKNGLDRGAHFTIVSRACTSESTLENIPLETLAQRLLESSEEEHPSFIEFPARIIA